MQLDDANPYASPRELEEAIFALGHRRTNFVRGAVLAVIWEGVGFAVILLVAFFAKVIIQRSPSIEARIDSALPVLPFFVGPALFFGAFFAMGALASFSPSNRHSFGRTVLYVLTMLLLWTLILLFLSVVVGWPLRPYPLTYLTTLRGQRWISGWLLVGPLLFTFYLLWRRTRVTESLLTEAATRSKMRSEENASGEGFHVGLRVGE